MEFETEKPTHRGFAQLRDLAEHPISLNSFVAADRQRRRINKGNAGLLAVIRWSFARCVKAFVSVAAVVVDLQ